MAFSFLFPDHRRRFRQPSTVPTTSSSRTDKKLFEKKKNVEKKRRKFLKRKRKKPTKLINYYLAIPPPQLPKPYPRRIITNKSTVAKVLHLFHHYVVLNNVANILIPNEDGGNTFCT